MLIFGPALRYEVVEMRELPLVEVLVERVRERGVAHDPRPTWLTDDGRT